MNKVTQERCRGNKVSKKLETFGPDNLPKSGSIKLKFWLSVVQKYLSGIGYNS